MHENLSSITYFFHILAENRKDHKLIISSTKKQNCLGDHFSGTNICIFKNF